MAISPSDIASYQGQIEDYKRRLEAQQKQHEEEIEYLRRNQDAELQRNYKNSQEVLRERDRDAEDTISSIRESSNEALEDQRIKAREDIRQLKKNTYDRLGHFADDEKTSLRDQLGRSHKDLEIASENHNESSDRLQEAFRRQLNDLERRHMVELEDTAKISRDSAREAFHSAYETEHDRHQIMKDEVTRTLNRVARENTAEADALRRETNDRMGELAHSYDRNLKKIQDYNSQHMETVQRELQEGHRKEVAEANLGHAQEINELRQQLSEMSNAAYKYTKGTNEGRTEGIKGLETEYKDRIRRMQHGYEDQISRLKGDSALVEKRLAHANALRHAEQGDKYSKIIREKDIVHHNTTRDMQLVQEKEVEDLKTENSADRERARDRLDNFVELSNEERDKALKEQAKAFAKAMADQRGYMESQIDQANQEIRNLSNLEGAAVVPAGLEEKIRASIETHYADLLRAEGNRHRASEQSLREGNRHETRGLITEFEGALNRAKREGTSERDADRREFMFQRMASEEAKNDFVKRLTESHNREVEGLQQVHARLLERQRQQYEEAFQTARVKFENRIAGEKQDSKFNLQMERRDFSQRQNELIRSYKRQLTEQKTDFDEKMRVLQDETRREVARMQAEMENILEQQKRTHEHDAAQAEASFAERERSITASYEDQIDELKRYNRRLARA